MKYHPSLIRYSIKELAALYEDAIRDWANADILDDYIYAIFELILVCLFATGLFWVWLLLNYDVWKRIRKPYYDAFIGQL